MIKLESKLAQLISRGGIYYYVEGGSCKEILSNIINSLSALPPEKHGALLKAVMERETLVSTGIENGIALPHPRTPMLEKGEHPFVAIAFPAKPIEWGTPDSSAVHTIFLIVSESPKQHLNALTKINFLCMDKDFYSLLESQAPKEKIIAAIEEAEKGWVK